MPRTKKNPITDPTGEKAAKRTTKAKDNDAIARENLKARLQTIQDTTGAILRPINNVASAATTASAKVANTVGNVTQAINPLGTGYGHTRASANMQHRTDVYGGLQLPEMKFDSMVPGDLLNPDESLPQATEEQMTRALSIYAGATRAQQIYQAGFKYIEELGKTKQQYHKAEQSVIKASTEAVKVDREIAKFDRQNVELSIDLEKINHSEERLRQAQILTTALQNETAQLATKYEAMEQKRDAEINSIRAQTQNVIQKYLKDSINTGT